MPNVKVSPNAPIDLEVTFDTPLRINVDFLSQRPGQESWRTFYSAKVSQEIPSQTVRSTIEPMPSQSKLLLTMVFAGSPGTNYKASVRVSQGGNPAGQPIVVTGSTGNKYSAFAEVEIALT